MHVLVPVKHEATAWVLECARIKALPGLKVSSGDKRKGIKGLSSPPHFWQEVSVLDNILHISKYNYPVEEVQGYF